MPPRKQKAPSTLERKIYFYRANIGKNENGEPLPFDPNQALTTINQLPFTDTNGRYLEGLDGEVLCGWVDDNNPLPRMRFGLIRRSGLPQIEHYGNLTDLNIATDAGLVEPVHVVFFPDNIVGVDFNFHGPRLSRLGYYLNIKGGKQNFNGTFDPLLRNDVVSQLDRLGDIRLFDLKIRSSYAAQVKQADEDLGAAFESALRVGDADDLEIIIRPAKMGRTSMMERLINIAKSLSGAGLFRSETSKFTIKGRCEDTSKVESIDLLHDQLIKKKLIIRMDERSRALDMNSAYNAISIAYEELGDELKTAPSIFS
ncbi:MAG: hypothetical protein PHI97_29100 [Desulfobulbus sp.]|nr:hypothetical protein [Desulfobulbus sp.]